MAADALEPSPTELEITLAAGDVSLLASTLANANIRDVHDDGTPDGEAQSPRPLHIYTRAQLLTLSVSPLVKVPDGMPELKDWFGCVLVCAGSWTCRSVTLLCLALRTNPT